jgi:hypothetical protein
MRKLKFYICKVLIFLLKKINGMSLTTSKIKEVTTLINNNINPELNSNVENVSLEHYYEDDTDNFLIKISNKEVRTSNISYTISIIDGSVFFKPSIHIDENKEEIIDIINFLNSTYKKNIKPSLIEIVNTP